MRIAFYISGKSSRLSGFLQSAEQEAISHIKLVFSEYEIPEELKTLLIEKQITYFIYDYKKIEGNTNKEKNRILSNIMLECFEKNEIDYCFSFGSHLLAGELLEKYKNKLINFHPAILPMFPGVNAIDQAIAHGNTFLVGNTAHFIDSGMDTGKIIMQSVVALQRFYDNDNDYECVLGLQIEMLKKLVRVILENRLSVDSVGNVKIVGADYSKSVIFPVV